MKPVAMSRAFAEIFAGPLWKAEMLRGELELEDIPAFIPDSTMKRLDPFDVGGNVFDFKLLVPAEHAARAREIVGMPRPEQYVERPAESLSEPRVDDAMARLEAQGRRIQWSALVMAFAPYGMWLAMQYVPAAARSPQRPAGHRLTLFATTVCLVECVGLTLVISYALRSGGIESLFNLTLPA
jgi:hypothetical protein